MPGVKMVEALAQCGAVAVLSQPENRGKLALFAGIDDVRFKRIVRPGDVLDLICEVETVRGPVGKGKVRATVGRRRARRARHADLRGGRRVIGRTNGRPVSITGLGCHVPERVLTNDELARFVDTSRRVDPRRARASASAASPRTTEAMSDLVAPGGAARRSRWRARPGGRSTSSSSPRSRPTWPFRPRRRSSPTSSAAATRPPTTSRPAAPASCTRSPGATAMSPSGLSQRALVVGGDVLSHVARLEDRSTLVLFGDGAGAVVLEHVDRRRLPRLRARRRRRRRRASCCCPRSGSRLFERRPTLPADERPRGLQVRDARPGQLGRGDPRRVRKTVDDVDVYVPHQANVRIIDHASKKLGIPEREGGRERRPVRQHVVGLDPARARRCGRRRTSQPGKLVLMTGMGAGLTWGSALIEWTHATTGADES